MNMKNSKIKNWLSEINKDKSDPLRLKIKTKTDPMILVKIKTDPMKLIKIKN